jgi:hypothetical protein
LVHDRQVGRAAADVRLSGGDGHGEQCSEINANGVNGPIAGVSGGSAIE